MLVYSAGGVLTEPGTLASFSGDDAVNVGCYVGLTVSL